MHYTFKSTPTYTFKSRTQSVTKLNQLSSNPGPGDYNVTTITSKPQTIAKVNSQRSLYKNISQTPGPGQYEAKNYLTSHEKYSLRKRINQITKHTPSPQDYNNNTIKVKNQQPSFSMSMRNKSYHDMMHQKNNYKPSPTSYQNLAKFGEKKSKIFIGSSQRKPLYENQKTPAPSAYQIEASSKFSQNKSAFFKIGNQNRNNFVDNPEVSPGPAVYDKKSFVDLNQSKKKGFTCRKKTKNLIEMEIAKVPGPGQYEASLSTKNKAPSFSPGRRTRQVFIDETKKHHVEYPGPGQHDPKFSTSNFKSNSCFNFSKSKRKSLYQNQITPASNAYKNEKINLLQSAPRFSLGKQTMRHADPNKKNINPGPGNYEPSEKLIKTQSTIWKMGTEKRPNYEKKMNQPGPGQYNLRGNEQGPKWRFSQDRRDAFTDLKNEAKDGNMYETSQSFPNPPKYMNSMPKLTYKQKSKA